MKKLKKLIPIKLREIWTHEATDFTRWMALEDNISMVLDEIGISAENIKTEDNAGNFNVDITADEVETGKKIIIENQLEKTDHKHLGQLLTYASSFDACIIVWVVANVRDEHKQAIEWFNRNINDGISFFLVKTEVWQIGDSDPAVKFNVIVEPNDWAKITKNSSSMSKELTQTKIDKLKFWEGLKDYAESIETQLKITRKPRPQHWYTISIGIRHLDLNFIHNTRTSTVSVELYIKEQSLFNKLAQNKEEFNSYCNGLEVDWQPLLEKKASRVITHLHCDLENSDAFPKYYNWLITNGELFTNILKKLN
jgi:hypothetical protein